VPERDEIETDREPPVEGRPSPGGSGFAARSAALLVSLILLALVGKALYPVDLPVALSPDFIDTIFDNRFVIWAARLLLVSAAAVLAFGGVFIALSIGIRIRRGHWLSKAGPFEISGAAEEKIESHIDFWRDSAIEGRTEIKQLKGQLQESDELAEELQLQRSKSDDRKVENQSYYRGRRQHDV
jgi:hypothetical protein